MVRLFQSVVFLLAAVAWGFGQLPPPTKAPTEVSVCDLIQSPQTYDGNPVRVRGNVTLAFEDFTLSDPECQSHWSPHTVFSPIWLTYGGDVSSPAVYCCGSHEREKGSILEVEGQKISLIRDAAYQEFRDGLEAQRLRRPDGSPCYDECKYYRITATISGVFFAAKSTNQSFSGYGHLGCCHLLVIQRISQVKAERTNVPIGGEYECAKEIWTPNPEEAGKLTILNECPKPADCEEFENSALAQVAMHWNDKYKNKKTGNLQRYIDVNGNLVTDWISSDLLTRYVARAAAGRGQSGAPPSITRTSCRSVPGHPPKRGVTSVSCSSRTVPEVGFDDAQKINALIENNQFAAATRIEVKEQERLYDSGDQSWRFRPLKDAASHLLHVQAEAWNITLGPELEFDSCEVSPGYPSEVGLFGSCGWFKRDGVASFFVSL